MSIPGCDAIASPTTRPVPPTRLNTPGGRPAASTISANWNTHSGASSLGFSTTVQPAAMARHHLRHDLVQRVVPRRDATDDTDGLTHDERVADRRLEGELAQDRRVRAAHRQREADLDALGDLDRRAHLRRDGRRELRGAFLDAGVDALDRGRALLDRRRGPPVERAAGRLDRAVDVGGRPVGHAPDDLLGRRADDVDETVA